MGPGAARQGLWKWTAGCGPPGTWILGRLGRQRAREPGCYRLWVSSMGAVPAGISVQPALGHRRGRGGSPRGSRTLGSLVIERTLVVRGTQDSAFPSITRLCLRAHCYTFDERDGGVAGGSCPLWWDKRLTTLLRLSWGTVCGRESRGSGRQDRGAVLTRALRPHARRW